MNLQQGERAVLGAAEAAEAPATPARERTATTRATVSFFMVELLRDEVPGRPALRNVPHGDVSTAMTSAKTA